MTIAIIQNKEKVMDIIQHKHKKNMTPFIAFLMDTWSIAGFGGTLLTITGLLAGASLPDGTVATGMLVILVSMFQKIRDDLRRQRKFKKQMEIIDRMLSGQMPINEKIVERFMSEEDEDEQ